MGRADEIINFLFRSLKGRLVLIACTAFIAMMCSGCFLCSCPGAACANAGCDVCAECYFGCNDVCIDACGSSCGGCGDSCAAGCLDNNDNGYIDEPAGSNGCCGGCGCDDEDEEPAGSDGCCGGDDDNGGGGGGYFPEVKRDKIYTHYVVFDGAGNLVNDINIYTNSATYDEGGAANVNVVPGLEYSSITDYFIVEGVYRNQSCTDRISGSDGYVEAGTLVNGGDYYAKLIELDRGDCTFIYQNENGQELARKVFANGDTLKLPNASEIYVPEDKELSGYKFYGTDNKFAPDNNGVFGEFGKTYHSYNFRYVFADENQVRLVAQYKARDCEVTAYVNNKKSTYVIDYGAKLSEAVSNINTDIGGERVFVGWAFSDENFRDGIIDVAAGKEATVTVNKDMVIYAVYKGRITVRYHNLKGLSDNTVEEEYAFAGDDKNHKTLDPIPVYDFVGWYSDKDFRYPLPQTSFTVSDPDGDGVMDVYARWEAHGDYTIKYYIRRNGVSGYILHGDDSYPYSETNKFDLIELPAGLELTGYDFMGWSEKQNSETGITSLPRKTFGDKTLYAAYKPKTFSLKLTITAGATLEGCGNPVGGVYTYTVKYDSQPKIPVPSLIGYAFEGWKDTSTGEMFTDESGKLKAPFNRLTDVNLTAQFGVLKYTVRFVDWDNSLVSESKVEHNGTVAPPAAQTRQGYTWLGWANSLGEQFTASTRVTSNMTITAVYLANTYRYSRNLNGGTGLSTGNISVNYDATSVDIGIPGRQGYTFVGWKDSSGALVTGSNGVLTKYNYVGDMTFTAEWSANALSITVYVFDGNTPVTLTAHSGDKLADVLNGNSSTRGWNDRSGYTYLGWARTQADYNNAVIDGNIDKDGNYILIQSGNGSVLLYAVYRQNTTLTLHYTTSATNDVTQINDVYVDQKFTLPTLVDTGNRKFVAWYKTADYDPYKEVIETTVTVTLNMHIYAKWMNTAKYTITYKTKDTASLDFDNAEYTKNNPVELDPVKERVTNLQRSADVPKGYKFVGWSTDVNGTNILTVLPKGHDSDITLYAIYNKVDYSMKLSFSGGGVVNPDMNVGGTHFNQSYTVFVHYGDSLPLPVPTSDSHNFSGWYYGSTKIADESGVMTALFSYESNIDITAMWTIKKFTVTFDCDGTIETREVNYGTKVSGVPTAPKKTGQTFMGWFEGTVKYDANDLIKADHAYVAKYEVSKYTITINAGTGKFSDGKNIHTMEVEYNKTYMATFAPFGVPKAPSGKTFKGWSLTQNGETITDGQGKLNSNFTYTYEKNITLYAIYE